MELFDANKDKIADIGVMAIHKEELPTRDKAEKFMEEGVTTIPTSASVEEAASIGSVVKAVIEEHSSKGQTEEPAETAVDEILDAAAQAARDKVAEFGVMSMPQEVVSEVDAAAQKAQQSMEEGITTIRK